MRRSRIPRHVAPFGADRLVIAVEPDEPPGTWSSQARLMEPPPSVSLPERSPIGSFARQATHAGSPRAPARSRRRSSGLVQGRDLPERCGKWKSARQRFARWAAAGIWERVLASLTADPARPSSTRPAAGSCAASPSSSPSGASPPSRAARSTDRRAAPRLQPARWGGHPDRRKVDPAQISCPNSWGMRALTAPRSGAAMRPTRPERVDARKAARA